MAADPLAALEGKLDSLPSDADIMDRFSRILIDETPALLRTLFRNLWLHRYGAPWVDGPECGDELMFGPADFSHLFGNVSVENNKNRVQCGLDIRFKYQGDLLKAGVAPAAWPQGLWPGCRVRLGGAAGGGAGGGQLLWLVSPPSPGYKMAFKDGVCKFNLHVPWNEATGAAVPLWGRTRTFYDRQTRGNSAAKSVAAQRKLRAGVPGEWDLTTLLWLLLNSAHDAKPNLADDAEGMLFGLGAEAAALVAGLKALRKLRNDKHGHTGAWSMTALEFLAAINRIRGTMAQADALAAALGWADWPVLEGEFVKIVMRVVDEKVTEADRLRYVAALRGRPIMIPFPRNKQFTGRVDKLSELEAAFFPGPAAADGGDADGGNGDGGYAPEAGGAAGDAPLPQPPPAPHHHHHHHHVITQGSLKGMGGIGKTGLAVEYAWRAVDDLGLYPGGVLTLRAESLQSLADSLRDVALTYLAIDDKQRQEWEDQIRKDPTAALDTAWWYVRRWLEANDELWLLLVDNADDRDLLLGTKMWKELQTLQAAVAAGGSGGHVLVTSRAQEWPGLQPIDVSTVPDEDAACMIVRYRQNLDDDAAATAFISGLAAEESAALNEIVKLLDGLPIALEFAGMYMRSVHCCFTEYLRRFNQENQIEFMGRKEGRAESILQEAAGNGSPWSDVLKKVGLDGEDLGYEAKLAAAGIATPATLMNMQGYRRRGNALADAGVADDDYIDRILDACEAGAKHNKSVATTWRMTVQRLSEPARHLLNMLSLVAPDGVPMGKFLGNAMAGAGDAEDEEEGEGKGDAGSAPVTAAAVAGYVAELWSFSLRG
eukprot:g1724.t1